MEDRTTEFDVPKMTRTFRHSLSARRALEVPIDRAQSRVRQSPRFLHQSIQDSQLPLPRPFAPLAHPAREPKTNRALGTFFERFGILNLAYRDGFDLFGRENTELDCFRLLDRTGEGRSIEVREGRKTEARRRKVGGFVSSWPPWRREGRSTIQSKSDNSTYTDE